MVGTVFSIILYLIIGTLVVWWIEKTADYVKRKQYESEFELVKKSWSNCFREYSYQYNDYFVEDIATSAEPKEIYAWKLFKVALENDEYVLKPIHQKGNYNIIDENHYVKAKNHLFELAPITISKKQYPSYTRPNWLEIKKTIERIDPFTRVNTKRLSKEDYNKAIKEAFDENAHLFPHPIVNHSFGFYSWNNPAYSVEDYSHKVGTYILAKILIWGEVIEAWRGYQSEYFEIKEFYAFTPDLIKDHRFLESHSRDFFYIYSYPETVRGKKTARIIQSVMESSIEIDLKKFREQVYPISVKSVADLLNDYNFAFHAR